MRCNNLHPSPYNAKGVNKNVTLSVRTDLKLSGSPCLRLSFMRNVFYTYALENNNDYSILLALTQRINRKAMNCTNRATESSSRIIAEKHTLEFCASLFL